MSSVPWLRDHVVLCDIIYPAAGYISMVGEAIRQLSKSTSFTIRHLALDSAMILRDAKTTEIITRLQPHRPQSKNHSSSWYDFTVSSYNGNAWITNCAGRVRGGQSSAQDMFPSGVEAIREVGSADWYRVSKSLGYEYGHSFQALSSIRCAVERFAVAAEVAYDRLP